MEDTNFPCWMYSAQAPNGQLFQSADDLTAAGPGWVDSPAKVLPIEDATPKASDGLTVPQLKEALTAKGIEFAPTAKKDDLVALLDALA